MKRVVRVDPSISALFLAAYGLLNRAEERREFLAPSAHQHRISHLGLEPGDRVGDRLKFLRVEVDDRIE